MEFNVGDRVIIRGDYSDYTDHLDGCVGIIEKIGYGDCKVFVEGITSGSKRWWIWKENLTLMEVCE